MEEKDQHIHTSYRCKCKQSKNTDGLCDGSHKKYNEENSTNIQPEKVDTPCQDDNCEKS